MQIDITNCDATCRTLLGKCMPDYVTEFSGAPWFGLRGTIANLGALMSLSRYPCKA